MGRGSEAEHERDFLSVGLAVRDSIDGSENALLLCGGLAPPVLKMLGLALAGSSGTLCLCGVDSWISELRSEDSAGDSRIDESGGRDTAPCAVCLRGVSVTLAAVDIGGTVAERHSNTTPTHPHRRRADDLCSPHRRHLLFYVSACVYLSPRPRRLRCLPPGPRSTGSQLHIRKQSNCDTLPPCLPTYM